MKLFDRLNDDGKLKQRFYNKRINAAKEGIEFFLTPKEFMRLLAKARIKSSDLGIKKYHLARYKDRGPYTFDNCRFVWYETNLGEKKVSEKSRKASARNIRLATKDLTTDDRKLFLKASIAFNAYLSLRKRISKDRRKQYELTANKSYLGERNSQFGSFWITNGKRNLKWREEDGKLPKGFKRGRII